MSGLPAVAVSRAGSADQAAGSQRSVPGIRRGVLFQVPPPTRDKSAGQEGCSQPIGVLVTTPL